MKTLYYFLLMLLPASVFSQHDSLATHPAPPKQPHHSIGLGLMAGLNFTNITSATDVNNSSETGYLVGVFYDPGSKSVLGSRTELVYSHQGYNFSTGMTTGRIYLDYLMLSQFMAINITHFVQIQIGSQMGYLLNAKSDSSQQSTGYAPADNLLSYYNRFIFGFTGGLEVRPFLGIIAGARYNLNLTNLYKIPSSSDPNVPPGIPSASNLNFKNNLVQIYVGYRF